jgi:hypothetical protein
MAIGRPVPVCTLTDGERDTRERLARPPPTAQALLQRTRICVCLDGTLQP